MPKCGLKLYCKLIKALTIKQSNDIEATKGLTDLQVRSMENNLILHNVKKALGKTAQKK